MKWLVNLIHAVDRKDRNYVSDGDRMLQAFDNQHPTKSASQLKEINKHQDIFRRDIKSRINWD